MSWFSPHLSALLRRVDERTSATCAHLNAVDLPYRFNRLERLIMATFEEAAADLAALTDDMAARLTESERINAELRAAVDAGDTDRAAALSAQAAQHTAVVEAISERLRGIGADASDPVPDVSPLPDVAAPADAPVSGGSGSVPDGEPLPEPPAEPTT